MLSSGRHFRVRPRRPKEPLRTGVGFAVPRLIFSLHLVRCCVHDCRLFGYNLYHYYCSSCCCDWNLSCSFRVLLLRRRDDTDADQSPTPNGRGCVTVRTTGYGPGLVPIASSRSWARIKWEFRVVSGSSREPGIGTITKPKDRVMERRMMMSWWWWCSCEMSCDRVGCCTVAIVDRENRARVHRRHSDLSSPGAVDPFSGSC